MNKKAPAFPGGLDPQGAVEEGMSKVQYTSAVILAGLVGNSNCGDDHNVKRAFELAKKLCDLIEAEGF